MKKTTKIAGITAAIVLASGLTTGSALAFNGNFNHGSSPLNTTETSAPAYVDADNDGICDNYGTGIGGGYGYIDEDGNGVCDNLGTGIGGGYGYIDEDSNGVCDNLGTGIGGGYGHKGAGMGHGQGYGHHN